MTREELVNDYVNWMYDTVCSDSRGVSYFSLFCQLYEMDFTYTMPMDGNRAEDGVELRYRFGHERGIDQRLIAVYLDNRPCSVLEMMIALAIRCETHLMDDPDIGDRVGQWFWEMIVCLGLNGMTDDNFRRGRVIDHIERFLDRDYAKNGKGGLFEIHDPSKDMRQIDIWYQMQAHLREITGV